MNQQQLRAQIVIGGKADASMLTIGKMFDQWGDQLLNLGTYINPYSQQLINLGKESVTSFASYEDVLLKIKSVGEMTSKEMEAIDKAARHAGATSRYTAQDAGEAALILTQVGLDYKETIELLPDILRGAQAGDISIASATDYIYSSLKNMGLGIEYADTLIDQMAKTASVGSSDFDGLGQSITRMGSAVNLVKGGSSEVLTILSAMSEFGEDMRGSEGGTALRNFMMSLVAPAGGRNEVEAFLGSIGSSVEELDEIMEDVDLSSAAKAIKELGIDIYDSKGKLRDGVDIIKSLRDSVEGLTEEQQLKTLGQIFGKRTISTAMNLIKPTDEQWSTLQSDIENSEGYAKFMADTQESGLGGALRVLESQLDEFKLAIGDTLAESVKIVAGAIGDIAGYFSGLDETTKQNWVIVMGAIAGAGPAMLALGAGLKFMAFLTTPGGAVLGTLIALAAVAGVLKNIADAKFSDSFGQMELDMEALRPHIETINSVFGDASGKIDAFSTALATAQDNYETASTTFSTDLLTAMLTGASLSQEDIVSLGNLGGQMVQATLDGIGARQSLSSSMLDALFNGSEESEAGEKESLLGAQSSYFEGLYEEARAVGENLRRAMTEALKDGEIDANDREAIMAQVARLNAIQAAIADEQRKVEQKKLLHKAQNISLESLNTFTQEVHDEQERALAESRDAYSTLRAEADVGYDRRYEEATTQYERDQVTQERERGLAALDREQSQKEARIKTDDAALIAMAWRDAIKGGEFGAIFEDMLGFAEQTLASGGTWMDIGDYVKENGKDGIFGLLQQLELADSKLGGFEQLLEMVNMLNESGMEVPPSLAAFADIYNALVAGSSAFNYGTVFGNDQFEVIGSERMMSPDVFTQATRQEQAAYIAELSSPYTQEFTEKYGMTPEQAFGDGYDRAMNAGTGTDGSITDNAALMAWASEEYKAGNKIDSDTVTAIQEALLGGGYELEKFGADGKFGLETFEAIMRYLEDNPPEPSELERSAGATSATETAPPATTSPQTPTVSPGTSPVTEGVKALDGSEITTKVGADTTPAETSIKGLDGKSTMVRLTGDDSAIREMLQSGYSAKVRLSEGGKPGTPMDEYAEGGRATEASIFGEGSTAEWAIPEAHTNRTRELLQSAAAASGFDWSEMIGRTGGLNANPFPNSTVLVYAPVIHAKDATDVEAKLNQDKERFDRWWEEKQRFERRRQY